VWIWVKNIYHRIFNRRLLPHNTTQYLEPNNRESRSYKQIKKAYTSLSELLTDEKFKVYISGGFAPYLLLNQDSGRLHDDIDTVVRMEDIGYFRKTFQEAGLYNSEYDSQTFAKDGQDYGFEIVINGVPVGIYPFTYKDKRITQYSYDPYTRHCKIKEIEVEELSDYIMTYEGIDGRQYNTMSMEYIKFSKDKAGRPKDIVDSKRIESYGIRQDVYGRLKMFNQIQDVKAEKLDFINRIGTNLVENDSYNNSIEAGKANIREDAKKEL